jgi:cellulose synthase/poly-beta-1,6-N-acetylglucosamine synthase-like glycosyltransferase
MMIIIFSIVLLYLLAICWLIYGCSKVPLYSKQGATPKTTFSILVPFRNEAENLPILLESLSKLKYPTDLFEVILVDDNSDLKFKINDLKFKISLIDNIRISNSPKKDAITTGVPMAKNEWIVTTDADCVAPENWLQTMDAFIQNHSVEMIAGAVTYDCKPSFLHHFQHLDFTSLQGATIGSFGINKGFMCNGANFAYTKSLFQKLNGFAGNDKIASGDDVFLLQKAIAQYPEKVHYLKSKETIVRTQPTDSWKALFHQRVRWASKTSSYQSRFGIGLGLVVFAGNLSVILGLVLGFLGWMPFIYVALLWLAKFMVDAVLLYTTHRFLTNSRMRYGLASSFLYPFFSTSVVLFAFFGTYEWKGRRF